MFDNIEFLITQSILIYFYLLIDYNNPLFIFNAKLKIIFINNSYIIGIKIKIKIIYNVYILKLMCYVPISV